MRLSQRLIAAAVLVALSGALAGCGGGGMSNFDPTDLLDFLDTKKKLPGERKPVFPEGVPGLEQGVPKELYKGSAQEQLDQQNAAAALRLPRRRRKSQQAQKSKGKKAKPAATASTPRSSRADADPMPRCRARGEKAPRLPRRRRPSPRRSSASAPPRRRRISRPRSPPRRRNNNRPHRSRRRCRAILPALIFSSR